MCGNYAPLPFLKFLATPLRRDESDRCSLGPHWSNSLGPLIVKIRPWIYVSSQRNSGNRTSGRDDLFFFGLHLILGNKLDDERREDLFLVFTWFWGVNWTSKDVKTFFFGLHQYFQWKRKQEIAAPSFSNFWARPWHFSTPPLTCFS